MLNKLMLIGRVGKVELKGDVTRFSIATNYNYTKKDGEKVQETEWHNCVAFGKLGEIITKYVDKGSKIYTEGRLKSNEYTDKEGVTRKSFSVISEKIVLLDSKNDKMEQKSEQYKSETKTTQRYESDLFDEEVPF